MDQSHHNYWHTFCAHNIYYLDYILITNLMHQLLFIQVLIFRRT